MYMCQNYKVGWRQTKLLP